MAKFVSKKYPLVVYTHMINRWWPSIFWLGAGLLALAWIQSRWGVYIESQWWGLVLFGAFVILVSFIMLIFRKAAYVRLYSDHLMLATPFLRLNISYKRVRRAITAQMAGLFPTKGMSNRTLDMMEPLLKRTTIVVELNGFPTSQTMLRMFLSPYFFKDTTPHFVFLIDDWMGFSSQLESLRSGEGINSAAQKKTDQSILSRLPRK